MGDASKKKSTFAACLYVKKTETARLVVGYWDGLKGYVTNTDLPGKTVYEEYSGLWQVERAFRITKNTVELRRRFILTKKTYRSARLHLFYGVQGF